MRYINYILFYYFIYLITLPVFAQYEDDSYGKPEIRLSSNQKFVLNNKDLHNIGCDQIIVFKANLNESFLGNNKGVKYLYNEWIIYRNNLPIDTISKEIYKPVKGWGYEDDAFFNIFPYAGVYKLRLNIRAYVTGNVKDDWPVLSLESNHIIVHDDFMPKLMGGKDSTHIKVYNSGREVVLDCSTARCMKEYFVVVHEYDEDWLHYNMKVQKIYYGETEEYLDLFALARSVGYALQPYKNYQVLVGPGANIEIDPNRWYLNAKFRVEPPQY